MHNDCPKIMRVSIPNTILTKENCWQISLAILLHEKTTIQDLMFSSLGRTDSRPDQIEGKLYKHLRDMEDRKITIGT